MRIKAKKTLALLISFVLVFSLFSLGAELSVLAAKSPSDIYKMAEEYTVEIQVSGNGFTATGSGFFVSADGNIVTNYHVIEDATNITVLDNKNKKYSCNKIVAYDANIDLAIIDIDVKDHAYAKISYSYGTGDMIYTLGSSKGLEYTFADGLISTKSRKVEDYNKDVSYIQISAPISSGNSGGPLINDKGEVIGVNTWSRTSGQNLNFAVPLSYLKTITHYNYTLAEFIKNSKPAYNAVKKAAIAKGQYDDAYLWYELPYSYATNDDSTVYISLYYDPEYDEVLLRYNLTSSDGNVSAVYLHIPADNSELYIYGYFNGYSDCTGKAIVVPKIYEYDALEFSFDEYNGIESNLSTLYSLAFAVAINYWDDCLSDLGVSMGDFGFTNVSSPKSPEPPKYTLTLDANGGSVYSKTVNVASGRSTVLTTPTRKGYKCLGWATSKDAKSAAYKCGASYKPSKKITLYALWEPLVPEFSSVSGTKDGFTAKWKKHAAEVTGYQVQYSLSNKFTSPKTVTVSSYKTVSKTVSKLTNGKKYYVRLRAYKTENGAKRYSGWSGAKSVVVAPKTTSISSLSANKGGFTVKWKKQTTNTTGYQIQYSLSSKFTSPKTVTVSSNKTVSKSISKLKKAKKYYVRVRTYKTISDKKYYSGWSGAKSVKTKK